MPLGANNGFDAERFAKLMAGFDTGNACEAEAISKGRAMRRMLVAAGLRFVDVMERADVKQALDDQLQPVREDSAELSEVRKKAAEWREEVTVRIQQVRQLAELLKTREQEFDAYRRAGSIGTRAGLVSGGLTVAVVVLVMVLLIAAALR